MTGRGIKSESGNSMISIHSGGEDFRRYAGHIDDMVDWKQKWFWYVGYN